MRPVVVGLDNPHSDDPKLALHPSAFPNSAGSRLYQMVREVSGVSELEYLSALELVNILDFKAGEFVERYRGRTVVVLGSLVAANLQLRLRTCFVWQDRPDFRVVVLPHPSGNNRVYNDRSYRLQAGEILSQLIREQRQ